MIGSRTRKTQRAQRREREAIAMVSTNTKRFMLEALKAGLRVDGRTPLDRRHTVIQFGRNKYAHSSPVQVHLGKTK